MWLYAAKRVIALIPVLIGTTFIAFMVLYHFAPGDPFTFALGPYNPEWVHEMREIHGMNDPILIHFVRYISGVFTGDFGTSFRDHRLSITNEIMPRFMLTLRLSLAALSAALILAFPIGIAAAVKKSTWIDRASIFIAIIGISMPVFWLGLLLLGLFSFNLEWFPTSGAARWNSIVLPGIALGSGILFAMVRSIRSSILDIMRQDYIKTAQAKGLSNSKVIRKHMLRNALAPILKAFKLHFSDFFTGIVLVEVLFSWPGIGRLFIQGIAARDYPMILGCLVMFILFYAVINILVDIAQVFTAQVKVQ
ncbi:MAG: ABC transporter permease [Defluviitaleaceae bacterium]|nr:ABC transporter permease [Defluviitaleaceae bacterium]